MPEITNADQIGVEWEMEEDGGSPIEEYKVFKMAASDQQWQQAASGLLVEDYTATGLTQGEYYRFGIIAKNMKCESEMSSIINILAAQEPSAP